MGLPCHQECKYHGFLGLVQWCRHPDRLGPIYPNREADIEAAGGKVDWEAKVMPGHEPPWPMPVDLRDLFPREQNEPTGYKNNKMSAKNDTCGTESCT